MKNHLKILFIALLSVFVLVILWQVAQRVFFTEKFVLRGNHYAFVNKYNDEEFQYAFHFKNYIFKNNECKINQCIGKRYDTSIVIDQVFIDGENIDFAISCQTSWKYQGGIALTNFSRNADGSSGSVMRHYKLVDSNGTEIPYRTVSNSDHISYIVFDKSLLENSDGLTLYLKGFNELTYIRKSI